MQITADKDQSKLNIPRLTLTMRYARWLMGFSLLFSDVLALILAFGLASLLRLWWLGGIGSITDYQQIFPIFLILILVFAWQGLYKNGGITQIEELRIVVEATSIVFLLTTTITFLLQSSQIYSRFIFLFAWAFSVILLPVMRWISREIMTGKDLWGEPVAIVGNGSASLQLAEALRKEPKVGFKPFIIIGDQEEPATTPDELAIFRYDNFEAVIAKINAFSLHTVLVVQSDIPTSWLQKFTDSVTQQIQKVIFIPDKSLAPGVTVRAYDLGGMLGMETHHDLLNPWRQLAKRIIDLVIAIVSGIVILPLMLVFGILIKLNSPGAVFYRQIRIGKNGKEFMMWKFRTMIQDADQVLEECLKNDPLLQAEWDVHQKLQDDPRVTRVGQWVRKLSLDELPQLFNVFKGEMSIVGPRPFMPDQYVEYGDVLELYKCTAPGITGLWQVSGRNNTSYEERVRLDGYYVRNWTIWLDFYILLKTVWVVISRDGAY